MLGALVGVAGIVLAIFALRKNQSKGMAIAGIILGSGAVIASISATIGIGAVVEDAAAKPIVIATHAAEPAPAETIAPAPVDPVEYASALIKEPRPWPRFLSFVTTFQFNLIR